jgi:hypothetical protein
MPDDRRLCRRVVGHAVQLDRPAAVPERRRASTRTDSTRQTRSTSSATAASSTAVRTRAVRPARPCDGRVDHVKPQPSAQVASDRLNVGRVDASDWFARQVRRFDEGSHPWLTRRCTPLTCSHLATPTGHAAEP